MARRSGMIVTGLKIRENLHVTPTLTTRNGNPESDEAGDACPGLRLRLERVLRKSVARKLHELRNG